MLLSHETLHAHVNGKRVRELDGVSCIVLVGSDFPQAGPRGAARAAMCQRERICRALRFHNPKVMLECSLWHTTSAETKLRLRAMDVQRGGKTVNGAWRGCPWALQMIGVYKMFLTGGWGEGGGRVRAIAVSLGSETDPVQSGQACWASGEQVEISRAVCALPRAR